MKRFTMVSLIASAVLTLVVPDAAHAQRLRIAGERIHSAERRNLDAFLSEIIENAIVVRSRESLPESPAQVTSEDRERVCELLSFDEVWRRPDRRDGDCRSRQGLEPADDCINGTDGQGDSGRIRDDDDEEWRYMCAEVSERLQELVDDQYGSTNSPYGPDHIEVRADYCVLGSPSGRQRRACENALTIAVAVVGGSLYTEGGPLENTCELHGTTGGAGPNDWRSRCRAGAESSGLQPPRVPGTEPEDGDCVAECASGDTECSAATRECPEPQEFAAPDGAYQADFGLPQQLRIERAYERLLRGYDDYTSAEQRRWDCQIIEREGRQELREEIGRSGVCWLQWGHHFYSGIHHPRGQTEEYEPTWGILGSGYARFVGRDTQSISDDEQEGEGTTGGESELDGAFGLGVEYRSWVFEASGFARFGTEARTISGPVSEYGHFLLEPAASNASVSSELWAYPFAHSDRLMLTQSGFYARQSLGFAQFALSSDPSEGGQGSGSRTFGATAYSLALGATARTMAPRRVGLGAYFGFGFRRLFGDISHNNTAPTRPNDALCIETGTLACAERRNQDFRRRMLGTVDRSWSGWEMGFLLYVEDIKVDFGFTKLHGDNPVAGLTGGQLMATIEFRGGIRTPVGGDGSSGAQYASDQFRAAIAVTSGGETITESGYVSVGDSVTFDASGSSVGEHAIDRYAWDFDARDGVPGSGSDAEHDERSVTHSFDEAGTFIISLRVTDESGNERTTSRRLEVRAPAVEISTTPASPTVGEADPNDVTATVTIPEAFRSSEAEVTWTIDGVAIDSADPEAGQSVSWSTRPHRLNAGQHTYAATIRVSDSMQLTGTHVVDVQATEELTPVRCSLIEEAARFDARSGAYLLTGDYFDVDKLDDEVTVEWAHDAASESGRIYRVDPVPESEITVTWTRGPLSRTFTIEDPRELCDAAPESTPDDRASASTPDNQATASTDAGDDGVRTSALLAAR